MATEVDYEEFKRQIKISKSHEISVFVAGLGLITSFCFLILYTILSDRYMQNVYLSYEEQRTYLYILDKIDATLAPIKWMMSLSSGLVIVALIAIIIAMFTMKIEFPRKIIIHYKPSIQPPEAVGQPIVEAEKAPQPISEKKKYCMFCGAKIPSISEYCKYCGKKVKMGVE